MNKKVRYFILVLALVASIHKPVAAAPTSEQVQSQKQQLQVDKNDLKKAQDRRFEIEQNIEDLDNQIEEVMSSIQENKNKMNKLKQDIITTEKEIKQSEEDVKKEQELFGKRVRAFYINGIDSYLEILLESDGFSDFLSRAEALKNIIEQDRMVVEVIESKQEELGIKKNKLTSQSENLSALNEDNNKKIDKLKSDRLEQDKLIEEAQKQERLYASEVNAAQTKLNETLRQIEEIRRGAPKYTPSRGAAPVSNNAVVAYASNFLGTPYLWGGTTPAGFDCSGFTQYVYRHFGISITRTTYTQIHDGFAVSRDQLQPGDLVFFGRGGTPGHVGIYVGNGMMIHAPHTGDVIKISSYDRPDYIIARRLMR